MKAMLTIALALISATAMAATTGTLNLSGVVSTVYSIVVNGNAAATSLDIIGGESATLIASVDETSNNAGGYKIRASSANNGQLKNGSVDQVSYQVSYDNGSNVSLSTSMADLKSSGSLAGLVTDSSDVKITFSGHPSAAAGTFSDTITFEIAAP